MTIEELGDILGVDLVIRRHSNQDNRYSVVFENTEVKTHKSDGILGSNYGEGKTAQDAINDYTRNIRGKWLVINAYRDDRKEFGVPNTLTT